MTRQERIVYQSHATLLPDAEVIGSAIDDIVETSRRNNESCDLTGALVYSDGMFMQVLEGPAAAVDAAMTRILDDRRHKNVRVLRREAIDSRLFPGKPLAFVSAAAIREAVMGSGKGFSMDICRLPPDIFAPLLRSLVVPATKAARGTIKRTA